MNIVRNLRSIYSWQGKVEDESEVLMIVKTQKKLFHSLSQKVRELHSYSVPEIIALPIVEGSEDYLEVAERGYRLKLETAEEVSLRANVPRLSLPHCRQSF